MRKAKVIAGVVLVMYAVSAGVAPGNVAIAQAEETSVRDVLAVHPRYTYTGSVNAQLDFTGNVASCSGTVSPSGPYAVKVTVSLYKQSADGWSYITSWTSSSSKGISSTASGSTTVSKGTYMVETRGNVGNLEYPVAQVIRTY